MAEEKVVAGKEAFEQLVALVDYPMFVVTTRAGDEPAGCLVGFTSQVSIRLHHGSWSDCRNATTPFG
jgi:flavin reductase (DIM6/NTAB) family NADH-FMN oxidoreductase RutF